MAPSDIGRLFGRRDVERCDLFIDSGFLDWGPYDLPGRKRREKRQLLPGGPQTKCAIQKISGYFETEFKTVNVGTDFVEPSKLQGRSYTKPERGPWRPTGPSKRHATPGDVYGTFAPKIKAFSPLTKPEKRHKEHLKNFLTKPGKKGNCGYLDITINEYPEYKADGYDKAQELYSANWKKHKKLIRAGPMTTMIYPTPFFGPDPYVDPQEEEPGPTYVPETEKWYWEPRNVFRPPGYPKKPGNNHDGCFEKFPEWEEEPYMTLKEVKEALSPVSGKHAGKIIRPAPQIKSYYTCSIVNNKIDYCCNERTWKTMKPITYPQFN